MGTALEDLRPIGKCMIIDCVQSAGIDVRAWGFRKKMVSQSRYLNQTEGTAMNGLSEVSMDAYCCCAFGSKK